MGWGVFLLGLVGTLAKKVLVSLGFGVIVFTGVQALKSSMEAAIDAALGGMASDVYQLVALAGGIDIIGIWLGAITTAMAFTTLKKLSMTS